MSRAKSNGAAVEDSSPTNRYTVVARKPVTKIRCAEFNPAGWPVPACRLAGLFLVASRSCARKLPAMLRPRKKYTVYDLQQLKGKRCLTHIHVKSPEEAAAADAAKNADRAGEAVAFQNAMPEVPASLGTPKSLEGLMARADDSAEEEAEAREHIEAVREAEAAENDAMPPQEGALPAEVPDEE